MALSLVGRREQGLLQKVPVPGHGGYSRGKGNPQYRHRTPPGSEAVPRPLTLALTRLPLPSLCPRGRRNPLPRLTKVYSAVESSTNCSARSPERMASMLLAPTGLRKFSSMSTEARVTASRRLAAKLLEMSQSTREEPAFGPGQHQSDDRPQTSLLRDAWQRPH